MVKMDQIDVQQRNSFISGYFANRMMSGEMPEYGYPKNHLPPVASKKMTVKSGFMAARAQQK